MHQPHLRGRRLAPTASIAALMALAGTTLAGPPQITVIYSDILTSPTSEVPGLPGARFSSFDRPYRSPDGLRFVMSADTDLPTTMDEVILSGMVPNCTVVVQEGTASPDGALIGLIDGRIDINDSGVFIFASNSSGPTTSDELMVLFTPDVGLSLVAQEGGEAPGIVATTLGSALDSGNLSNAGMTGFRGTSLGGQQSTTNAAVFLGGAPLAHKGVTVPMGQLDGDSRAWELFDTNQFFINADGTRYILKGDLQGGSTTSDDVLVVDGSVVLQEGFPIPGSGFKAGANAATECFMNGAGDWFARGSNADGIDWVLRNGDVVASTDEGVPGGFKGETIDDTLYSSAFFLNVGNNVGDYVYGATTSNADPEFDAVLVLNGERVIARQGDAVDLDGNGVYDDDAYIDIFNNDDAFMTDDGRLYFTADLRNGLSDSIGQAFLCLTFGGPACPCDWNTDSTLNSQDFFDFLADFFAGNADYNTDGTTNSQDFFDFLGCFFAGC